MTFHRSTLTLGLLGLLGLVGLTGCGTYEEAVYPEAPPPERRQVIEAAPEPPEVEPPAQGEGQDLIVGGDNDDNTLYRETDPSALTDFRPALDPYGAWVDDETYGTVWVPSTAVVGADFTPYVTAGRWTYDDGYVWVSDYDWGWAPFHYGRWVYIAGHGWSWIPGRVYRGAWVVWRTGPVGFGYVGWGPAPPDWYWRGGYAYGFHHGYQTPYYFCETRHVFQPQVGGHVVRGPMARDIGKRTEPYVPAEPRVDQGRVSATPRVAGVAGEGAPLTASTPTGLRRGAAGPEVSALGLESSKLPRPTAADKGVTRAYDFGAPRTAVALGARPPSSTPRPVGSFAGTAAPSAHGPARVGGVGPAASDRSYTHPPRETSSVAPSPQRLPPTRTDHVFTPPPSTPRPTETYRSPPMVEHHRAPVQPSHDAFHSTPSYSPPSYSPRSSAPSAAPRSPSVSAPSRSSSMPSTVHTPSVSRPSSSPPTGGRAPSAAPRSSSTTKRR